MQFSSLLRIYVRPWIGYYLVGFAALVATNALSVEIPLVVASAIDSLGTPDASRTIPLKAAQVAVMGVLVILVRTLSRVAFFNPGRNIEAQIKRDMFEKLIAQQPSFLRHHAPGDLVSRSSSDINNVRLLVGFGVLQAVNTVMAVSFAGAQMLRISPLLAVWTLLPIGIGLAITQISIRQLFALIQQMQAEIAGISDHVLSSFQGVATIQAFGAEHAFLEKFDERNNGYLATSLKRANLRTILGPALGLSASINVFVLLWLGGPLTAAGKLTVGELIAWTTLVAMLVSPLRGMSFLLQIWKQAQVGLMRLGEVMNPVPERPDLPNPVAVPFHPPNIEVRDLSYAYPDEQTKLVLENVSFQIGSGKTLGILGATGSGKTTLLRILSRLYNPPVGTVFIDGVDIRTLDLDAWRDRMVLVPQRAFLFSDSLKGNILLGQPDDGRAERMISLTTLDVDVAQLPQGALSPVGESGIMLSGGQRQRVALARGLLRPNQQLLMLDDVLSAVDHHTEHLLLTTLRSAATRPTTILVAHRLSALRDADHILVLDHGRIVDQGTHHALITRPGLYQETWERQSEQEPA